MWSKLDLTKPDKASGRQSFASSGSNVTHSGEPHAVSLECQTFNCFVLRAPAQACGSFSGFFVFRTFVDRVVALFVFALTSHARLIAATGRSLIEHREVSVFQLTA